MCVVQMGGFNKFETERYVLETLERVAKNRSDYKVLYANVSKLKPKNRHPQFVKVIARLFDDLVAVSEGRLFVLNNGDCVILGKNLVDKNIEITVDKLRRGLITDPIWAAHGENEFTKLYEPEDFEKVVSHIQNLIDANSDDSEVALKTPLDAGQIEVIKNHLDEVNIVDVVKHQKVFRFEGPNKFRVLFEEFFVAVKDLSKLFDKNVDLTANKWLFLYLTQMLDKKTMYSFAFSRIKNKPKNVSLNLNLSTMFLPEFEDFVHMLEENGQKIIAEVQLMDILNNMRQYFDVRELLHKKGHQILIDSASIEMLQAFNIKNLGADYVKIFWHSLMGEYNTNAEEVKNLIADIDVQKVILAKCLDEQALRWGIRNGIRAFQGPYIDMLDVALTRMKGPGKDQCSAEECLKRKRYIAGPMRDACHYKEFLEKEPE